MNWSLKHTVIAGLVLIAGVNVIALSGVAYNRNGEAESVLRFSERELHVPYVWRGNKENSGLELRLQWRVLPPDSLDAKQYPWRYSSFGVVPEWLNEAKMAALGFESPPVSNRVSEPPQFERQLPRDVLLVLELDGAAYQTALARAVKYGESGSDGAKVLVEERNENSRLFVVDAGLDKVKLRAKYPDRGRYAILRGQVRPASQHQRKANVLAGFVSEVNVDSLNVPLEMKSVFEGATATRGANGNVIVRYDVEVAIGQRLEPWIIGAARKQP